MGQILWRTIDEYLVGEITIAATWFFFAWSGARNNLSTTGIRNASVLPLPVTASTTVSLFPRNSGMVDACTGVIRANPILSRPSSSHCDSGGLTDVHARGSFGGAASSGTVEGACSVDFAIAASVFLALAFRLAAATIVVLLFGGC
jgi:hypothetical protein